MELPNRVATVALPTIGGLGVRGYFLHLVSKGTDSDAPNHQSKSQLRGS